MESVQVIYGIQAIEITGQIEDEVDNGILEFLAAAPPEVRSSYHGTGLPWSSRQQAMSDTPNIGHLQIRPDKTFTFEVVQPNAYYDDTKLVPPQVELYYMSKGTLQMKILSLQDLHITDRSLRHAADRSSPMFYNDSSQAIRTQAEIFASKAVSECPSFMKPYQIRV